MIAAHEIAGGSPDREELPTLVQVPWRITPVPPSPSPAEPPGRGGDEAGAAVTAPVRPKTLPGR